MADYSAPIKGEAFVFDISLLDAADTTSFKANPTLASGDVKVRLDDGAETNITTLPTAISSSAQLKVSLSTGEMNADRVAIAFVDAAGGEWLPLTIYIYPKSEPISADMVSISGATASADALELQYDGTGLIGDTYPATQAQVGNIAIAGAAINTVPESYVLTTGTESANAYTDARTLDGIKHTHTDSGGAMDLYYEFDIGGDGVPTSVKFDGALTGNNDTLGVYAYNWAGTAWGQIGTVVGKSSSSNETKTYDLLTAHVGTGGNSGKVRIRFYAASGLTTAELYVDRLLLSYALTPRGIANGSAITLTTDAINTNLVGHNWTLNLNGQGIQGSYIYQAVSVSGISTGVNGSPFTFQECNIGTVSLDTFGFLHQCAINDTLTLTSTAGVSDDNIQILSCYSGVAGAGAATIDASGTTKTTSVHIRDYHGGLNYIASQYCTTSIQIAQGGTLAITTNGSDVEIRGVIRALNITLSGAETVRFVGICGHITLAGATTGASTINVSGVISDITNNTTGDGVSLDDDALNTANISDGIWDELDSGHTAPGTFGETITNLDTQVNDISNRIDITGQF